MTGDKELPAGEMSETGGEEEVGSGGPERERSGGAKNPTCRTLGSLTVRGTRRASIWGGGGLGLGLGFGLGFGGFRWKR